MLLASMIRSASNQQLVEQQVRIKDERASSAHQQSLQQSMQQQQAKTESQQQQQERQEQRQERQEQQEQQQQQQQQTSDSSNKPKRNPFCSRCRNHGKSAQVKGHKRHCEYRDCQCEGCKLVECRQMVSAAQIKRRRYQKQDEECGRRIEISPPVLVREPSRDPAVLIAKTLMGQATPKQVQQQVFASSAALSSAMAVAAAASANSSTHPRHLYNHHHHQQQQQRQIALVEEVHQTFGPLAIYAWLRAEHFNLQKVLDLIELSRLPFEELLQMTGHSPLDLTSPIVDV